MKQALPLFFFLCSVFSFAQEGRVPAFDYLRDRAAAFGLSATDLAELRITDEYASPSGVVHVYVEQRLYGTPVFNAQAAVHFRAGKALHHTVDLQAGIHERATATVPRLTSAAALRTLDLDAPIRLEEAELTYYATTDTEALHLSWYLVVEDRRASTHTLYLVDATSGTTLFSKPLTISCQFDAPVTDEHPSAGGAAGAMKPGIQTSWKPATTSGDGAMYHVFPFGLESPNDGPRELEFEPADEAASPYGWHDTDGKAGAEYTYTRGNNVYAYRDADTINNQPDPGYRADGGAELDFDFAFTPPQTVDSVTPASMVQLFYTNNMLHDWTYHHGFDEAAGNFQENNYDRGGRGKDYVRAETQDVTGSNNANFYTPRDGRPPRMQMYLWKVNSLLTVSKPENLAGNRTTGRATFGAAVTGTPVRGQLVVARDATTKPDRACGALANAAAVAGKVAVITRGDCSFEQKAHNAQRAGAIGVIICNTDNSLLTMGAAAEPNDFNVTIPVVMLRARDCAPLVAVLQGGGSVTVEIRDNDATARDGSFDNGVVAHEYGHGISNRLVGGPNRADCLLNDEQMGEGWSDFFLLASTPQAAGNRPDGTERRGIGVYSIGGGEDSRGFRSQFYSTDFSVNNHTYDDIILAAVPHGIGETWASMLWDVYWKMVDTYGFDDDLINGTGGNNAAVRLVIEALKYTPCSPGIIDGRDALLIADEVENGGANKCLLWEVFQRRGLGPTATQGDSRRRNDNREAFGIVPECIATVKVAKAADATVIDAGDLITFTLTVRNDKATAVTGVAVTDEVPDGLTFQSTSVRTPDNFSFDRGDVTFEIGELGPGEQRIITYTVVSDPNQGSRRLFFDGAEEAADSIDLIVGSGDVPWVISDSLPFAGAQVYRVVDAPDVQDQILQLRYPIRITGSRPALRFFTKYATEPAYDAGIVQVSTNGTDWENVADDFQRFRYRGLISSRGTEALRGTPTFWGDSEGYHEAIIDLATYSGQEVYVRWRFMSDRSTGDLGWWVDDIELVSDLFRYNGRATVTTAEGDTASAYAPELGVVVNSGDFINSVARSLPANPTVTVFPNPATELVTISLEAATPGTMHLQLHTVAGRLVRNTEVELHTGANTVPLAVGDLPAGTYTLRIVEPTASTTRKLTVGR